MADTPRPRGSAADPNGIRAWRADDDPFKGLPVGTPIRVRVPAAPTDPDEAAMLAKLQDDVSRWASKRGSRP